MNVCQSASKNFLKHSKQISHEAVRVCVCVTEQTRPVAILVINDIINAT